MMRAYLEAGLLLLVAAAVCAAAKHSHVINGNLHKKFNIVAQPRSSDYMTVVMKGLDGIIGQPGSKGKPGLPGAQGPAGPPGNKGFPGVCSRSQCENEELKALIQRLLALEKYVNSKNNSGGSSTPNKTGPGNKACTNNTSAPPLCMQIAIIPFPFPAPVPAVGGAKPVPSTSPGAGSATTGPTPTGGAKPQAGGAQTQAGGSQPQVGGAQSQAGGAQTPGGGAPSGAAPTPGGATSPQNGPTARPLGPTTFAPSASSTSTRPVSTSPPASVTIQGTTTTAFGDNPFLTLLPPPPPPPPAPVPSPYVMSVTSSPGPSWITSASYPSESSPQTWSLIRKNKIPFADRKQRLPAHKLAKKKPTSAEFKSSGAKTHLQTHEKKTFEAKQHKTKKHNVSKHNHKKV